MIQASHDGNSSIQQQLQIGLLAASMWAGFPATAASGDAVISLEAVSQRTQVDCDQLIIKGSRYFIDGRTSNGLIADRLNNHEHGLHRPDEQQVASIAATGYGLAILPIIVDEKIVDYREAKLMFNETLDTVEHISAQNPGGWLYHFMDGDTGEPALNSEVSTIDTAIFLYGAIAAGEYFGGDERTRVYTLLKKIDFDLVRTNAGKTPDSLTFSHGYFLNNQTDTPLFIPSQWDRISEGILIPFLAIGMDAAPVSCWTSGLDRSIRWEGATGETFDNLSLFTFYYPLGFLPIYNKKDLSGSNYWQEAADAVNLQQEFSSSQKLPDHFFGYSASDGPAGYHAYRAVQENKGLVIAPPSIVAALPFAHQDSVEMFLHLQAKELLSGRYGLVAAFDPITGWKAKDMLGIDVGSMILMLDAAEKQRIWKLMEKSPVIQRGLQKCGFHD